VINSPAVQKHLATPPLLKECLKEHIILLVLHCVRQELVLIPIIIYSVFTGCDPSVTSAGTSQFAGAHAFLDADEGIRASLTRAKHKPGIIHQWLGVK
jgi:hypothetical protein